MQITMLYTRRGSEDGLTVQNFLEGETYEMADSLASSFLRAGQAYRAECELPPKSLASPFAFRFRDPAAERPSDYVSILHDIAHGHEDFNRIFRPASVRPTNVSTLQSLGQLDGSDGGE